MDRDQIPASDKWNVEAFYASLEDWKKEFAKWQTPHWPELAQFRGRLKEGSHVILQLLETYLNLERNISKLYVYAHLRHDEDVGNDMFKEAYLRITSLVYEFRQESCWIEPEILQLPQLDLNAKEL